MHQELMNLIDDRIDILDELIALTEHHSQVEHGQLVARSLELHGLRQELCLLIA